MTTTTIETVRATLARLTPETRCSPSCQGWFVAESGSRGTEIQRCDECCHAIAGEGEDVLTDDDILLLPEAWVALASELGTDEDRERTLDDITAELAKAGYVPKGPIRKDQCEKFFKLAYTPPWWEAGEPELFAWGKGPLDPLLALVALASEQNAGDDQEERHEPEAHEGFHDKA